jgi:hypothetical protein
MKEPIPFAGWVDAYPPNKAEIEGILKDMLGDEPQNGIKYVILADGSVYYFRKEGQICLMEQTKTVQEGI